MQKRVKVGDARAIHNLGGFYSEGMKGLSQDWNKALELWHREGDLGHSGSYHNIMLIIMAESVERDKKKAIHYRELAAMRGDESAKL